MADDSRDLASRRGRPISEYGALFPGGQAWRWILGAAYAGLVALEAIGNERWRVAATPYLDIALFIGLIPTLWRVTRVSAEHERNAQMRAAVAGVKDTPASHDLLADAGLLDEHGDFADETPPAWLDELTPERPPASGLLRLTLRAILTAALAIVVWVVLLIGLAAVDWARAHWLIAALTAAALAGLVGWSWLTGRRRLAPKAAGGGVKRTFRD